MSRLPMTRTWSRRRVGGIALLAGILALAGASAALAAPAQHSAGRSTAAAVPWRKASLGWAIAEYSASVFVPGQPSMDKPGVTTLYLTSPTGAKYAFYSWPKSQFPAWTVVDWSGDRQRVLLEAFGAAGKPNRFEQVSLATRKVVSAFTEPSGVTMLSYTRPNGLNLLGTHVHGLTIHVVRYDLTGKAQVVLASRAILDSAIDSPNGTSVIIGTATGLEQVSNTGGRIKALKPPVAVHVCSPVRWWTARTVLAFCFARGPHPFPRLWLFPVGGGKVTALTPQRLGHGPDFGDLAAWRLSDGLYLQGQGIAGCGTSIIMRQWRNGSAHLMNVPFTAGDNRIVTGLGGQLLVWGKHPCGSGGALLWYNPGTSAVTFILRAVHNVVGVTSWSPYGRPLT
jgi:hypothetical protein